MSSTPQQPHPLHPLHLLHPLHPPHPLRLLHAMQSPPVLSPLPFSRQRGGTAIGFIFGLVLGLGAALGVAVYVTKVPVPFLNKGASRNSTQDAAEAQKNRNWDPNSPLYGKNPARPPTPVVSGTVGTEPPPEPAEAVVADPGPVAAPSFGPAAGVVLPPPPTTPPPVTTAKAAPLRDLRPMPETRPEADPLGDLARSREKARDKAAAAAATAAADPFNYFVQAGAFRTETDADAQRAKLAMMGWEARVSEREQNGRTVYRVRVGPFGKRDDAQQIKEKLDSASVDSALVRAPR